MACNHDSVTASEREGASSSETPSVNSKADRPPHLGRKKSNFPKDPRRIGAQAELEFERRLMEQGYAPVMTPARIDVGVDFCVLTTKGWMGVQVKCGIPKYEGRKGMGKRDYIAIDNRGTPTRIDGQWVRRRVGGKAYYASKGVTVFAIFSQGAFYLVPIEAITPAEQRLGATLAWTREAWSEVLGDPITPATPAQAETAEIEQMFLLGIEVRDA